MTTHEIKPVRRGRLAGTGDWRQQYAALRVSAEEAAAQIHNGDAVAMPGAASWPYAVDAALTRRLRQRHRRTAPTLSRRGAGRSSARTLCAVRSL